MLRVYNDTARYVDQGGGKRKGAFACYLEPWHADIESFLDLKKNHGKEELRARDLFYGLWICDLFMERVEKNLPWSLFDPNEAPGLYDCWGEEFNRLYEKYEKLGKARKTFPAQELWFKIVDSQVETGTPYIMYKDAYAFNAPTLWLIWLVATESPINKILEPSAARIYVLKSLSTLLRMKWLSVTSPR